MNYETVDLELTAQAAREEITDRVGGLQVREFRDRYEFSSPLGFHLAELTPVTLSNGEAGSRLTYRTAVVSPVAAVARAKAQRIRRAVEPYGYRD